jgi:hypothetical protein
MKTLARFLIPLTLVLIATSPALAEYKYRFEVFGAANAPLKKNFEITTPQSTYPMKGTQEFSLGGRGGMRLGADSLGHWGQDIIYSYGTNSTRIINNTTGYRFAFTSKTHQVSYNALWYLKSLRKSKRMFPFLTAGVGGTFYNLSQSTINEALDPNRAGLGKLRSENVFAVNAGGGVRFKINNVWGIRIDVRDYMSRAVRYGLPKASTDPDSTVFPVSGIFHQFEIAFAFVYYF